MQKANCAHVLYAMMTFIPLQCFLYILSYLGVASVISSMEFSEIKLLVAMVTMTSSIVFAYCIPSCALECAEFNSAFTFSIKKLWMKPFTGVYDFLHYNNYFSFSIYSYCS